MKVIKIGGGCLNGKKTISEIMELVKKRGPGNIFVVSALNGVTDILIDGMETALKDEEMIAVTISEIRRKHNKTAEYIIKDKGNLDKFNSYLEKALLILERYYYGLNFTREITPRMNDMISCFGERMSAELLSCAINSMEVKSSCLMPDKIGFLTDGKFGDATAFIEETGKNLKSCLMPLLENNEVIFIPGFFGISRDGEVTTFGRGGSDYSAAVAAVALNAETLEFWKDVDGFMSADPRIVEKARRIPFLSYGEAAELSYFGAKILHPRAVEPARRYGLEIAVKNTKRPDAPGSVIIDTVPETESIIKSVTQNTDVGILKVHASGVGARKGILASVAGRITENGINIKSVVTSQTCISILLDENDLDKGIESLAEMEKSGLFRCIEKVSDSALISIVGDGMHAKKCIAGKCFTAMSDLGINVDMISFGPSISALYFLVSKDDLEKAVKGLHSIFFG